MSGSGAATHRRRWLVWTLPAIGVGLLLVADDWLLGLPTLCLHKLATGRPCAGCGMTRAFVAIAHGDLDAALSFNPLFPHVVPIVGTLWWQAARAGAGSRPAQGWVRAAWWLIAALFVGLHVARQLGALLPHG